MGIMFGFELETAGRSPDDLLPKFREKVDPRTDKAWKLDEPVDYWTLTTDGSIGGINCEVVSPVNPKWADVRKVVDLLKAEGCRVTKTCGLHVHVSDPAVPALRIRLPKIRVWQSRSTVAAKPELDDWHERYGVTQVEPNHLEVRVFNAKIDYHYLLWAVGLVKRSLVYPKPGKKVPENDWDTKVVKTPNLPPPPYRPPQTTLTINGLTNAWTTH